MHTIPATDIRTPRGLTLAKYRTSPVPRTGLGDIKLWLCGSNHATPPRPSRGKEDHRFLPTRSHTLSVTRAFLTQERCRHSEPPETNLTTRQKCPALYRLPAAKVVAWGVDTAVMTMLLAHKKGDYLNLYNGTQLYTFIQCRSKTRKKVRYLTF